MWCSRSILALVSVLAVSVAPAAAQRGSFTGATTSGYVAVSPPAGPPVHLHIIDQGRGSPIVLLHGIGGSTHTFRHLIGPLSRYHRVVAVDLKGFGASEKPLDVAYGPRDQALLVASLMRRLELTKVTLVGHSFGGAVAILTALELRRTEPGRVRRLVLMNVPAYPQDISVEQRIVAVPLIGHLVLSVVPPILNTRAALASDHRSGPIPTDADAQAYAAPLHEVGGRHALVTTARAIAEVDSREIIPHYRTLQVPTLLIWCQHDPTVPLSSGERLAAELPRAKLVVFDTCDHKPAEEAPAETLAAMAGFLRRTK